jgi:hypothetical protein
MFTPDGREIWAAGPSTGGWSFAALDCGPPQEATKAVTASITGKQLKADCLKAVAHLRAI